MSTSQQSAVYIISVAAEIIGMHPRRPMHRKVKPISRLHTNSSPCYPLEFPPDMRRGKSSKSQCQTHQYNTGPVIQK